MRDVLKVAAGGSAVFVLVFALVAGIWGLRVATAGIYGRGEAHRQVQSAPSRIAAYNHFFDLCVSIQNAEAQIDAQQEALATAEDHVDKSRMTQNIAALKATRAAGINQYNADAAKDYTIGQFKDSDLPYYIAPTAYEGNRTSCTS